MTSVNTISGSEISCSVDSAHGARLSSLKVNNHELLLQPSVTSGATDWGAFPMVPWAGRIRNGVFAHGGVVHRMRRNHGQHSIHGTLFDVPWNDIEICEDRITLGTPLGKQWPFGGQAEHRISLRENVIECHLTVTAENDSMPVQVGWHPWFVRPVVLATSFSKMFVRDSSGIPTGLTVTPPLGPWDDCFTDARSQPILTFDHGVRITVESDCEYWVIYDQPIDAICVEPQSGPPDGFNLAPYIIEPRESFTRFMRLHIS